VQRAPRNENLNRIARTKFETVVKVVFATEAGRLDKTLGSRLEADELAICVRAENVKTMRHRRLRKAVNDVER
jgi:hypothetical protein